MDVVRPFIGVHRFEVHRMTDDVIFGGDPVAAVHVARNACDVERLAAIVALQETDHVGREPPLVDQPTDAQRRLRSERDFGEHVRKLQLNDLVRRERTPELLALERVIARGLVTEFGGAHRAPADAVTRTVEAAERPFQPRYVRQQRILADLDAVHHDFAGDRGAQADLALDLGRRQPLHPLFEDEAPDRAVVRVRLRPHDENVGDRRIGDPHLRALEAIAALDLFGARAHSGGVAPRIGFGEPETADQLARREAGEKTLLLLVAAIGVDRMHHERALHRTGRTIARIDALDFARDQPVADIIEPRAAIFGIDRRAEQPERAHFGHDLAVESLVEKGRGHARQQRVGRIAARGIAHHALLFGQLIVELEGVERVERLDALRIGEGHERAFFKGDRRRARAGARGSDRPGCGRLRQRGCRAVPVSPQSRSGQARGALHDSGAHP